MGHRITLRDVATAANVSVTTASLILNGRPARVSPDTRQRILDVAEQLNYVPNQNARSLVTKKSMLIALIVPDIENLFFASLSKQIEDCCARDGYSLIVANSDDSRASEHDLMTRLSSLGVDGMLLIAARESYDDVDGLREDVDRMNCPVMLVDRLFAEQWCDGAGLDNYTGGRLAADCLLDAGHTLIGCITGGDQQGNAADRVRGFLDALRERDVPFDPALKVSGMYKFRSGYDAADRLIDAGVTGVFCCNDLIAAGFIQRAMERGLQVPRDISVVGYDNILERYGLYRDVTTVDQRIEELAERCWEHLHDRIEEQRRNSGKRKTTSSSSSSAAVTSSAAATVHDSSRGASAGAHADADGQTAMASGAQTTGPSDDHGDGAGTAADNAAGKSVAALRTAQADKPWLTDAETILLEPHLIVRSTVAER
ncbi:LacI family DNA-binding transcriptional regulator [Bifidobacterium choloepi]|uniref:LacI family transcriptional regulator n=1 Tax=Bifidobacterium choloepi TaxID=2614131 RepID=A0A6I5N272_9BIFI|nr:LacI family DNA-binding transcriptional regulator [Bifidobacterium choloepi]NEG70265.1 LacI family transcriptional regulator [Bifidobacterium choloepi]